jgi:P-type conjugative transfer ATPase TrbB
LQTITPLHPIDDKSARLIDSLERNLGPVFLSALRDPLTIEVMLNPDGKLYQERLGHPIEEIGSMDSARISSALSVMATMLDANLTPESPILEGCLPLDGSRLAAAIPPIVSAPSFCIRKKASAVFTLDQYVESGSLTEEHRALIVAGIHNKANILVVGGTGTGKTTFTNAIIDAICKEKPHDRFCIIEDTAELQCNAPNTVNFYTSKNITMTQLLKLCLRYRPDRILVGEVRGPEALDLLDAWSTGHPGGVGTLHADSSERALTRLQGLVSRNQWAPKDINQVIAETVQLIVYIEKTPQGRRIQSISEVLDVKDGLFVTEVHHRK